MTKRHMVLIGLAAASIHTLGMTAPADARGPGMGRHHMMRGGPGRLIGLLLRSTDLTPDQQTQAHQILDTDRPTVQQLVTQLRQANMDLANLLLGLPGVPPPDTLAAQQAVIAQLQQQLAQHEASTVLAIRALLGPDQLAKANAALSQMAAPHADRRRFFGNDH